MSWAVNRDAFLARHDVSPPLSPHFRPRDAELRSAIEPMLKDRSEIGFFEVEQRLGVVVDPLDIYTALCDLGWMWDGMLIDSCRITERFVRRHQA